MKTLLIALLLTAGTLHAETLQQEVIRLRSENARLKTELARYTNKKTSGVNARLISGYKGKIAILRKRLKKYKFSVNSKKVRIAKSKIIDKINRYQRMINNLK